MRVAVVAEWYPSRADPVLGIWAHRQAVAARDAGAEVRVLALRRPIPPLSVFHIPPAIGELSRWIEGARTSLRPLTLDGLSVTPVPFLAPPRPLSYGSWGYWMAPPLARALDRLHAEWPFDVLHAHCLAPAGHAAARWVLEIGACSAFVVSAHGPDMIHVARPRDRAAGMPGGARRGRSRDGEQHVGGTPLPGDRRPAPLPAEVVHLGADLIDVRAAASENGSLRIVTVAHLVARKRHEVVLRAMAMMDPARRPGVSSDRRRPLPAGLAAARGELGVADRVRFARPAPESRGGGAGGGMRPVRDAGGRGAVRRGVRRGDGGGLPAIGSRGEGGPEDIAPPVAAWCSSTPGTPGGARGGDRPA